MFSSNLQRCIIAKDEEEKRHFFLFMHVMQSHNVNKKRKWKSGVKWPEEEEFIVHSE